MKSVLHWWKLAVSHSVLYLLHKSLRLPINPLFSFLLTVPPVILKLDEPERRHHTCIEFTVRGFPHPTLRWFHKGREILQSEYIRMEMEYYQDYLEGCLTFQNPTHYDNGNYTLVASNSLGSVTKIVYGYFLEPPFIEDDGKLFNSLFTLVAWGMTLLIFIGMTLKCILYTVYIPWCVCLVILYIQKLYDTTYYIWSLRSVRLF